MRWLRPPPELKGKAIGVGDERKSGVRGTKKGRHVHLAIKERKNGASPPYPGEGDATGKPRRGEKKKRARMHVGTALVFPGRERASASSAWELC